MSRPTQRWGSNVRQSSDDDGYDHAGNSSREWRTRQSWKPQQQSQPQQRNVPATSSSWQGAERQRRSWHRDAVTTLRQSGPPLLQQQQPLRPEYVAEVSSLSATALPWRTRNEFAEQQQNPSSSSWRTRERGDRGSQSGQEPFVQQRRAWPARTRANTHERMATGRATQQQMQIQRRPRDWDDTRLSPRRARHTDEQLPVTERLSHGTNAVKQSRPWRQAGALDTSHDSESEEIDFRRDCRKQLQSVAEFMQDREPAENVSPRATSSGRGTFTSSTRPTGAGQRVAAQPWATKANARQRVECNERLARSPGSRNGVVVDTTPMQATPQDNDCDPSSDCESRDDLSDDGDGIELGHIDDHDSRTRGHLVLGKRKAVDGMSRNGFDRRGNTRVAASAKGTVKLHAKMCTVEDCTSLVGTKGVCRAHGGGKRCQYPEGCGKSAQGATIFCRAHGGGRSCQYPDGCGKGAEGRTLFCVAHGGGKRCQYPGGCGKGAKGRTLFCKTHGGGKRCQYPEGCDKSARGAMIFCIAHGGGRRCQYPDGCDKGAEGRTFFCVAHGGGKRCQYPDGCGKSARGVTSLCRAHGGGARCRYPDGCDKSAIGQTMFCVAHGGGRRCQYPKGCDKGALGSTLFCIAHGGGKRCQHPGGCGKSAQGATSFCIAHGGGKRCQYAEGCNKSAQGETLFCKAHGGGKRCQYPDGCDKSAIGATLFCKAHGGGKRCQYPEGCDKSAQGATSFCRAHGGGKRCQDPGGCGKGAEGRTLFCIAHGGGRRCLYPEGCDKCAQGATSFCRAHGGGNRCIHSSGCNKHVVKRGMCKQHGVAAGLWV
jgi:hypothetical protein